MSVDSGLCVIWELADKNPLTVLRELVESGWRLDDNGAVTYLPVGDAGSYDWTTVSIADEASVWRLLAEKSSSGEELGVVLTWRDSQCGGTARLDKTAFRLSLDINRRHTPSGLTDVNWYIERLSGALAAIPGVRVSSWQWTERI